jgi:hypothetical protein
MGNTGILTSNTPALDSDIPIPDAADTVEAVVREWFEDRGVLLCRFGRAPKRALLFRTAKPFGKIVQNYRAPDGANGRIEVLGDGQQLVVSGTHPDTGRPYSWAGGHSPETTPRHQLPEISEDEAREVLGLVSEALHEKHGFELETPSNGTATNTSEFVAHDGPLDVDACLSGMTPNGASVNAAQPRAILSLLQKGIHPDDVITTVVDATMKMADAAQLGWRRDVEENCVTKRCLSSLKKLHDEYDPSTGVIPAWLAGEFHQAWGDCL